MTHQITLLDKTTASVAVSEGDEVFRFCDQDFLERFPALVNFLFKNHGDWMSGAQESLSWVFGLSVFAAFRVTSLT